MTKQEKRVLKKAIECAKSVTGKGNTYDGHLRLIEEGDPPTTMEDPMYKLGWNRCYEMFTAYLEMLNATTKDQIKFAGKAK